MGDEKVRGDHAAREGQVFSWDDPPEGGNPGEGYNCRCWAEPVNPEFHPWKEWVRSRIFTEPGVDAIEPTWSPFDFLSLGGTAGAQTVSKAVVISVSKALLAKVRDIGWIRNTSKAQFQSKFKHAKIFGITGNQSNKTLAAFKKALEDHVRSPDTIVKKGTYHQENVKHYFNTKTGINVIRNKNEFVSTWKLSDEQIVYMKKYGRLGGGN